MGLRGALAAIGIAGLVASVGLLRLDASADETAVDDSGLARATFAGGCFWCMEPPFDELDGVVSTISGYTGGRAANPSYEEVSMGGTGHVEAVQVLFDPETVSYETLLDVFWKNVDPTDSGGQFCDRGSQYIAAIFALDQEQLRLAKASKRELIESKRIERAIVTPIVAEAGPFYPAEEYHQDYYEKHPIRYRLYRRGCGRDRALERLWAER